MDRAMRDRVAAQFGRAAADAHRVADELEGPRSLAQDLDREHPWWVIWWGPRTRRFWAVPARGVASPMVEADRADALRARLREVEVWHGIHPARDARSAPA